MNEVCEKRTVNALRLARALPLLVAGSAVWWATSIASAQVVSVRLGTAGGPPGAAVSVPISVSGGAGLVAGLQVDVLFDSAVLGATNPSCTAAPGMPLSWSLPTSPAPPAGKRRLRLLVFDTSSAAGIADGQLGTCQFQISAAAAVGSYPLQGTGLIVGDGAGAELSAALIDGSIQVQSCSGCGCS